MASVMIGMMISIGWAGMTVVFGMIMTISLVGLPIASLLLIPFGWEIAACALFLEVFAETTPPGPWDLLHLQQPEAWAKDGARPVRHSFLHEDPRVFAAASEWISHLFSPHAAESSAHSPRDTARGAAAGSPWRS
jgi:hypothetical protein